MKFTGLPGKLALCQSKRRRTISEKGDLARIVK